MSFSPWGWLKIASGLAAPLGAVARLVKYQTGTGASPSMTVPGMIVISRSSRPLMFPEGSLWRVTWSSRLLLGSMSAAVRAPSRRKPTENHMPVVMALMKASLAPATAVRPMSSGSSWATTPMMPMPSWAISITPSGTSPASWSSTLPRYRPRDDRAEDGDAEGGAELAADVVDRRADSGIFDWYCGHDGVGEWLGGEAESEAEDHDVGDQRHGSCAGVDAGEQAEAEGHDQESDGHEPARTDSRKCKLGDPGRYDDGSGVGQDHETGLEWRPTLDDLEELDQEEERDDAGEEQQAEHGHAAGEVLLAEEVQGQHRVLRGSFDDPEGDE